MKKVFVFIVVLIFTLSGCAKIKSEVNKVESEVTKNDNQPPEEEEYKNKVMAALEAHDEAALKALFSKNARDNIEDFDFNIALLMKKYKGHLVSAKYDRTFPVVTEDKERGIKRIETYYVVDNDEMGVRFMYLQIVPRNDEDPDDIGISSMMFSPEIWKVTMDDSNRGYYLWVDNPFWGDYIDPDDVVVSKSEDN